MQKKDFYFDLPEELIAQTPIEKRDTSRLLVLDKNTGAIEHKHFYDIIEYLKPGDLLVMNNSKVIPARLYGDKEGTGAGIEFLLLEEKEKDIWEIMVKPGKKARVGAIFCFGEGLLRAEILQVVDGGNRLAKFYYQGIFLDILDQVGTMPLPHYITAQLQDTSRYQTVYSKTPGSAAAPTAGLHFTPELLEKIKEKGIDTAFVTLHVGLGTFRPVKTEDILEHKMHTEQYYMPKETAEKIKAAKARGSRVIAVGTTSCRTLESVARDYGQMQECRGDTDIFIYPGKQFAVVDGLITNFHLPESTLIMLVSALAGRENILNAYNIAIQDRYRFYSFGDAMLITSEE